MEYLWFVIIGIVAGWLAGVLTRGGGFGLVGNLLVGIIGSVLGGWAFSLLGIHTTSLLGSLATATVGAIVLIGLANLVAGGSSRRR